MKILDEELEQMEEPFNNTEETPQPTAEEVPIESVEQSDEVEEQASPPEEEPVGVDPADSFYPANEDYDYAPDVHLTGKPNDGIKYPTGSKPSTPTEEGDLGLEESKNNLKEEKTMKTNTTPDYKEAMKQTKERIAAAKERLDKKKKEKALKEELDLNVGDEYEIENPPIEDETLMDNEETLEEEPKTQEELAQDILADAEELYRKIIGEEDLGEEESEDSLETKDSEENLEDVNEEMFESKKAEIKEKIKANLKAKRNKEKAELKEDLVPKGLVDDGDVINDMLEDEEGVAPLDESTVNQNESKVLELYNMILQVKYGQDESKKQQAFQEALDVLELDESSDEAQEAKEVIDEEYTNDEDVFFDEARKRSAERKAYLKKILNEEDTPIMSDEPDVEELMGLKIIKKMGEDPKLVESRSKKFEERYKEKQSFDFKKLLENGFLG